MIDLWLMVRCFLPLAERLLPDLHDVIVERSVSDKEIITVRTESGEMIDISKAHKTC